MSPFGNIGAVVTFELRRALSRIRLLWWLVLMLFPVGIVGLIEFAIYQGNFGEGPGRETWPIVLFILIPLAVCMLGTFLLASPAIAVELERKSWVYLAVRPNAPFAVLLGKFLVAMIWTGTAALGSLIICLLMIQPREPWHFFFTMSTLIVLGCTAYSALYLALGVLFYKRAMIVAMAYTLIFEIAVSFIPALVNKFTIFYRLRSLFMRWFDISFFQNANVHQSLDETSTVMHLSVLALYVAVMLAIAILTIRILEFTGADESTT